MDAPIRIEIANRQTDIAISTPHLEEVSRFVLKDEQVTGAEISLAIVDSESMQTLNREHLDHDYDTDVLSFLLECVASSSGENPDRRGFGKFVEGEVIACAGMAARTAGQFGWSPQTELELYVVHGLLHILGYDDLSPEEQLLMRQRESEIMLHFGYEVRHLPQEARDEAQN